jgi:CSLREA domain-containing protein
MRQFGWIGNAVGFVMRLAVASGSAGAATIVVNTTDDDGLIDGDCSLREAIMAANTDAVLDACPAGSGTDEIIVPAGSYEFAISPDGTPNDGEDGDLDILADVTITGAGAATTIIDGGGLDRVLHVIGPVTVGISGVTIRRGRDSTAGGGGIFNESATLTLTGVVVEDCGTPIAGGGIRSDGTANLVNSTVRDNLALSSGGGIVSIGGTVNLTNSTVSGNITFLNGGGIAFTGTVNLIDSDVSDNRAGGAGSGIENPGAGTLSVTRSTIARNTAVAVNGGGVRNHGTADFTDSTIHGNACGGDGGGIENIGGGTVTATNATISGNTAEGGDGGGLYNMGGGTVTLTNTTVAGNTGVTQGGGIHNAAGTVTLTNTIVANNTTGGDCSGAALTSAGNNLDSDGTCGLAAAADLSSVDPLLGPLADNGGSTLTHDLLSGSPAVDAADNAAAPAADQRGITRPNDGNGDGTATADIGAVEQLIDCNTNGTHDAADVAGGASTDCDANGVPDECQPDADADGIIDACEVASPCGCAATGAVLMTMWALFAAKLVRRRGILRRAVRD